MVLVTGANGFVGHALCSAILLKGGQVRGAVREVNSLPEGVDTVKIKSVGIDTNWTSALKGVDVIVHLAARAHVMEEKDADPIGAFREVNVAGTERLVRMAVVGGIRRFIFLSSIGVNGCVTDRLPFSESNDPQPHNPYSLSKLEAEQVLNRIASKSRMELVVVRSPLVYGPRNPGNFLRLLSWVDRGWPLPLALVSNSRSFIYLGNLVDAIVTCINHPKAAGQTYLVSDGEDVSTPELIWRVADALGRPARLFPFPPSLIRFVGKLTGKSEAVDRLLGSLTVASSKIRRELGWEPPYTMEQGLRETAEWFKRQF